MRYHSIIILVLCILLPPLLYVASIQKIRSHLENKYLSEVKEIYLGDTETVLNGTVDIKNAVNENINQYRKRIKLLSWGVKLSLTISANNGKIIYPMIYGEDEVKIQSANPLHVAAENYNLLSQGFTIHVEVELRHNSLLTNSILLFYVMMFFLISFIYFRRINKNVKTRDKNNRVKLNEFIKKEKKYKENLDDLKAQKGYLNFELATLKKNFDEHKHGANLNEEELFNEIIKLDEIINRNVELQEKQEQETDRLKREIESFNNQNRIAKNVKSENKRLESIYKNLHINDRAFKGFLNLSDNLRIKGEKIIHDLNDRPSLVIVKRKVFNGKNGESVLETIFGNKGRLYFRYGNNGNTIEILAIGTKNSQYKDMEYLRKL